LPGDAQGRASGRRFRPHRRPQAAGRFDRDRQRRRTLLDRARDSCPHERRPRRRAAALRHQAPRRSRRGMALRRLRPRRARTAARAHRAAASVPAACPRAGCAARRAQGNGRGGAARGVIAPPRSPARCVTIAGKDVEDRGEETACVMSCSPRSLRSRPCRRSQPRKFMVEQMYVQYFLPRHRKGKLPLLMWHGGGLTGVTYETTPDGREGWLTLFVRKGWDVYVSDAVERGRAGFASPDVWPSEPIFLN